LTGALAAAGRQQNQVIDALEAMLKQLGQWDHYRRFHREMLQLVREQEELAQRTAELARDTLTRELRDLPPQQLADLKVRGQEQLELALRLDRLLEEMRQAGAGLAEADPSAADTIRDAVDEAQRQAVGGQMRQIRSQIEHNGMGLAIPAQKSIVRALRELVDILGGGRQQQLTGLEDAVRRLHARQETLIEETRRLDRQRPAGNDWTPQQEIALADAAQRQRLLQEETTQLTQARAGTGAVFRLALAVAARNMDEAAHQLDRREPGTVTQAFQRQALERLALLLKAFQPDSPDGQPPEGNAGSQGGQQGKPPGGVQSAAEIKLVKLLQEAINVRTQALSQADPHDDNVRQQYQALAEEQGSLAELILEMLRPK
jgi:hypothetical protein